MRAWEHGERAETTDLGFGSRPDEHSLPCEQSVAALAGYFCVFVNGTVAGVDLARDGTGQRDGGNDPAKALKSGGVREGKCEAGLFANVQRLSWAGVIRALPETAPSGGVGDRLKREHERKSATPEDIRCGGRMYKNGQKASDLRVGAKEKCFGRKKSSWRNISPKK